MRLFELHEPQDASSANDRYLTDEDMQVAYDKLRRNTMTKDEIRNFVNDTVDEGRYPRGAGSLRFLMHRMHIIMHGVAADGVTANQAGTWFTPSNTLISYVLKRDEMDEEDIQNNLKNAKAEIATRPEPQRRPRITPEEARMQRFQWMKANLSPEQINTLKQDPNARDRIEQMDKDILNGLTPEEAVQRHFHEGQVTPFTGRATTPGRTRVA